MQVFILRVPKRRLNEALTELKGWYPLFSRMTKPKNKKQPVRSQVPVFPGWIFVKYGAKRYKRAHDYGSVLKYGKLGPLWLGDDDIARIREICNRGEEEQVEEVCIGDVVTVDALGGWTGVVSEYLSDGTAKLVADKGYTVRVRRCLLRKTGVVNT